MNKEVIDLDASKSYLTNWDQDQPFFDYEWICPGKLALSCNTKSSVLNLNSDAFKDAKLPSFEDIIIKVNITANIGASSTSTYSVQEIAIQYYDVSLDYKTVVRGPVFRNEYNAATLELDGLKGSKISEEDLDL